VTVARPSGMAPFVWIDSHTFYTSCSASEWEPPSLIPNPKACVGVLESLASRREKAVGKFIHELAHGDEAELAWLKALVLATLVTIPSCEVCDLPEESLHTMTWSQQNPTHDVRILSAVSADQSRSHEIRILFDRLSKDQLKCWAITALSIGDINLAGGRLQLEKKTLHYLEVRRQPFVKLLIGVSVHEWCTRMERGNCAAGSDQSDESMCAEPSKEPLLQQLVNQLEASSAADKAWLRKFVWDVAKTYLGTRILQKAMEVCAADTKKVLLKGLETNVWAACCSPHANFMLQAGIRWMPVDVWQHFVLQELTGHYVEAAKSDFGCRVLQRLIEHCDYKDLKPLIDEVVGDKQILRELIQHRFGNYVVKHIFEHDSEEGRQQQKVVEELCFVDVVRGYSIYELARHRFASHVLDQALRYSKPACLAQVLEATFSDTRELYLMRDCQFGSFVFKNLQHEVEQGLIPRSTDEGSYRYDLVAKCLLRNADILGILKLSRVATDRLARHPLASSVASSGMSAPVYLWSNEANRGEADSTREIQMYPAGFTLQADAPWQQQPYFPADARHSQHRRRRRRAKTEPQPLSSGASSSTQSAVHAADYPRSPPRHGRRRGLTG